MNQFIQAKQGDFQKAIEFFKKEIGSLRTGRANPAMLDGVQVEAYGVRTSLNGLASIAVTDARSMTVSPWDRNILKDVEKAITEANLGMGIINEGGRIRLTLPLMTEENRKNLVKKLNEKAEDARISLRQVRDWIKEDIAQAEKDKKISEDDKFRFIKELDEEARERNDEIEEIRDKKEQEVMII